MNKLQRHNIHPIEQYVIDKVIRYRRENKISAKELAIIIHTSASFVSNVESIGNPAKYNLRHIYYIAKHFELSPKFFLPDYT